MMHVMNIADKTALFKEVNRVLRPGAKFGVYDVMRTGSGALSFLNPGDHGENQLRGRPGRL